MSASRVSAFDPLDFLSQTGTGRKVVNLQNKQLLFAQGDAADCVFYIQKGRIKLSVTSAVGREAVLAIMNPGEFLGEEALPASRTLRVATACAMTSATLLRIGRRVMIRTLHEEHAFSDIFVSYLLARTMRIQEDLMDQLFNSSEKRLARILLLLAQFGKAGKPETTIPRISQETLAEMVGTTRARVSFFMNRFRRLGFIQYNGDIHVHPSLLNIVLHD